MYNTMRITGLASGIDTEEMIQNLMKTERIKVNRVEQDRQTVLWRQEAYNSLNKDFANFILNTRKMFGLTTVSRTGTFLPNSYQNLNWLKKATSSDEKIATAFSTGKALDGNYTVEVHNLAEGVSLASEGEVSGSANLQEMLGANSDDVIEFTINGKKFVIGNLETDDEGNIIDDRVTPVRNENGDIVDYEAAFLHGNLGNIKLTDVTKLINSAKVKDEDGKYVSIGIRASYDAGIDRFFLQTAGTGIDAKIEIDADGIGADLIEALKLNGVKKGEDGKINYCDQGKDAKISFNGADNIYSSTNRITINGITMDLIGTGNFTITVATDVDAVYEKVEQFVNEYNELVEKTNKLLGEKVYRDYKPLTSEQKKAMDKGDIELWEEKAKSGILRNDDIIARTMLNIRQALYDNKSEKFDGPFTLITEIGISTEKYARGSAGGKLQIDEQKLKEAIAKDPEGVMEFLFKESVPEKKDDNGEIIQEGRIGGIVTRVYDNLMTGMEEIIKKSGTGDDADLYRSVKSNILYDFVTEHSSISILEKDILDYSRKIDDLNVMLFRKENSYYAKFAAMESAISRMNQQSMWLMQQFMG